MRHVVIYYSHIVHLTTTTKKHDKIRDEKLQYDINWAETKISTLLNKYQRRIWG